MASSTLRPYFATMARIRKRGRIRHRRSRCDRGRVVARHVRDRQRHDLGAHPGARQPAALDPRQMLANGVDLADRRARAQQSARVTCCFCANDTPSTGAIQFAEPPPDSSTSSRSSAPASCASRRLSSAPFSPASSGTGWPASITLIRRVGTPWPWRVVAMPGQPRRLQAERVEIMPLRRRGHRGRSLAGGKTDHPAFRHRAQMRRQHDVGMRGGDGGVEDRAQERASVWSWLHGI